MLVFYCDFLIKFVKKKRDFQLCEMDTGSLYMVLSPRTLGAVVKNSMKELYNVYWEGFPLEVCDSQSTNFITQSGKQWLNCVASSLVQLCDKRTPGLLKLVYGDWNGIISLFSKIYNYFGAYDKTSCKRLNKAHNKLDKILFKSLRKQTEWGFGHILVLWL